MSRPDAIRGSSTRITTATTTAVKSQSGEVIRVIVGTTAAGTITLNDSVGTKVVLKASIIEGSYDIGIRFAGKIEVVTAAASDVVVVWA